MMLPFHLKAVKAIIQ